MRNQARSQGGFGGCGWTPLFLGPKKKIDGVRVWQLRVQVLSLLHRRRPAYTQSRTESWKCCSVQSNLGITTTEGTGSGPIIQVVSFARFGSKLFNMELYTCLCASHNISDRWLPHVGGGVIGNDHDNWSLQTRWSLVRSAYEGKVRQTKKCFSLSLTYVVAFLRLNRRFGPTFGVRNSHFSGGRIFKNAVRTFESANWRDWNCVSAIFRWSLLSGGRKDRFDCRSTSNDRHSFECPLSTSSVVFCVDWKGLRLKFTNEPSVL